MSALQQLSEIFPAIAEDFLRGLCEAYDDNLNALDALVDVVLSIEYPPLKEDIEQANLIVEQINNTTENVETANQPCIIDPLEVENVLIEDPGVRENSALPTTSTSNGHFLNKKCEDMAFKGKSAIESSMNLQDGAAKSSSSLDDSSSLNSVDSYENNSTVSLISDDDSNDQKDDSESLKQICPLDKVEFDDNDKNELSHESIATTSVDLEGTNKDQASVVEPPSDDRNDQSRQVEMKSATIEGSSKDLEENLESNETVTLPTSVQVEKSNDEENCEIAQENITSSIDTCSNDHIPQTEQETMEEPISSVETSEENNSNHSNLNSFCETEAEERVLLTNPLEEKYLYDHQSNVFGLCNFPGKSKILIQSSKACSRRLSSPSSEDSYSSKIHYPRKNSFRSSKVKNEEQRLRVKLIRQNRLLMKNKVKNRNTTLSMSQFENADSRFSLLSKVLPDADPSYLSSQSNKIIDSEEMLQFISMSLENPNYPKMKCTKEEQSKLMGSFECSLEEFLQAIPDPLAEFSSDFYIRTGYEGNAELYLKSRYPVLEMKTIQDRLEQNKYNLTKVCDNLEFEDVLPSPYSLDRITLHHPPSIFFHQEVWFIEHRKEVLDFLDSAVEAAKIEEELNRPPTPPVVAEVFECEICCEDVDYTELGTCDGPSGHLFCKSCIKRNTEIKYSEGATSFPCLKNCGGIIHLQTIEEVLPNQMFMILMGKIQEAEVKAANIAGIESCPFCPYAYGPGDLEVFTCQNPTCMKLSCRTCRKEYHHPAQCDMFREEDIETARHYVEERMTEALIRECYKCGTKFMKKEGCNKMTCTCGAKMCYLCRQPVVDYTHFNGPGGDNHNRCELFSEEAILHERPVAASAQRAVGELLANNPGINLDASQIIP